MHDSSSAVSSGYQGIVDFPTVYGSMEIRILLLNNGSDLKNVHDYQNQIYTKTIPRDSAPLAPRLTTSLLDHGKLSLAAYSAPEELDSANATSILKLLAKLAPYSPPAEKSLVAEVDEMLSRAGIVNGVYNTNTKINTTAVNEIIGLDAEQILTPVPGSPTWTNYGNDWWGPQKDQSGNFHSAYRE